MANDRQYFTIIPNIIEDMDLSAIAFRLYFHIKRVAGEDGVCYQTTKTLAEKCNVSTGSISKAKEELRSKKLIRKTTINTGRGKPLHTIKIVDIWNQNMSHYSSSKFINSPGEFISSTGEIKKNPLRKTLKKDMADESAPDSGKDQNNKEIILQYPRAIRLSFKNFPNILALIRLIKKSAILGPGSPEQMRLLKHAEQGIQLMLWQLFTKNGDLMGSPIP